MEHNINGRELFLYLQERFKMSPKEAVHNMRRNGQDLTFLKHDKQLRKNVNVKLSNLLNKRGN